MDSFKDIIFFTTFWFLISRRHCWNGAGLGLSRCYLLHRIRSVQICLSRFSEFEASWESAPGQPGIHRELHIVFRELPRSSRAQELVFLFPSKHWEMGRRWETASGMCHMATSALVFLRTSPQRSHLLLSSRITDSPTSTLTVWSLQTASDNPGNAIPAVVKTRSHCWDQKGLENQKYRGVTLISDTE